MKKHQHRSNNAVLGAPPGTPIEQCEGLPITRAHYADGTEIVISYWMPDADELARLNAGKAVAISIWGTTHAPIWLGVDGDKERLPASE